MSRHTLELSVIPGIGRIHPLVLLFIARRHVPVKPVLEARRVIFQILNALEPCGGA